MGELVSGGGQEGFGGIPLVEQIIFNVTDLEGNPAPDVYVEVSISPDGTEITQPAPSYRLICHRPLCKTVSSFP